MPESNLTSPPTRSQERYRVVILIPRPKNKISTAIRLESESLSLCLSEAWRLVNHRGIPAAYVDILAISPVGLWCSIWTDKCEDLKKGGDDL